MFMPRPSGYCGATRRTLQSGVTNSAASITAASAVSVRARRVMLLVSVRWNARQLRLRFLADGRAQRHAGAARRYAHIARHLLVERGAEVRTIERIDIRGLRKPSERARLTGLHDQLRVFGAENGKTVQNVPVLLDVGDM